MQRFYFTNWKAYQESITIIQPEYNKSLNITRPFFNTVICDPTFLNVLEEFTVDVPNSMEKFWLSAGLTEQAVLSWQGWFEGGPSSRKKSQSSRLEWEKLRGIGISVMGKKACFWMSDSIENL